MVYIPRQKRHWHLRCKNSHVSFFRWGGIYTGYRVCWKGLLIDSVGLLYIVRNGVTYRSPCINLNNHLYGKSSQPAVHRRFAPEPSIESPSPKLHLATSCISGKQKGGRFAFASAACMLLGAYSWRWCRAERNGARSGNRAKFWAVIL